ncbi:MAG TPA: HAD-IA family hydrolase [Solirubrobacterales bacterium]|nr:HAD-IA family hydrolase [Solirubrobacterales bacterium]
MVLIKAVIFDLDDTLLDSSALTDARDRREWRKVLSGLGSVRPFEVAEDEVEVVDLPGEVRARGMAVGLLTHSPENYAEALLKRHGIKVGAMVTGSDGFPNKPDPGGLLAVAKELGVEPGECAYVGDAVGDFGAAAAAGMVSIGVSWSGAAPDSWRHGWPDIAVNRPARLLEYLDGVVGLEPLGEAMAAEVEGVGHWGSLLQLGANTFGLGRYFPTTDRRHPGQPLSRLLIDSKTGAEAQERLGRLFEGLAAVNITNPPELIVSVPPAPDGTDRFGPARAALADLYDAEDGGGVLRQLYGVEDYKSTRRGDRAAKVVDRFEASGPLEGRRIVLLDDVLTSGAQSEACRVALREAGAGGVSIIVAGIAQDSLPDPCPKCEIGTVRTKRRGSDGHEFLGCTRWPNCWWSEDLPD